MSGSNRAKLIGKLHTVLKKHYKSLPTTATRPLLEHVIYASLLQDAPYELADEGMAKCEQEFFDWNEVRVTSVTELAQVLSRLPSPDQAAARMKNNLQAIFEEFYMFDLDHMKKENLGRAVTKFERMPSMTPFVLNYTVQHGLGGHAIPIDYSAMVIMLTTGIASQPEANTGKVPGLERAISKNKGIEFAGLLHQCAVALNKSIKDKTARTVLESVSKGAGVRLDEWLKNKKAAKKRVVKRKVQEKIEATEAAKVEAAEREAAAEAKLLKKAKKAGEALRKAAKGTKSAAEAASAEKKAAKKPVSASAARKLAAEKANAKKKSSSKADAPAKKKAATKKTPAKKLAAKKVTTKKVVKKKTSAKKSVAKPAAKKVVKKKTAAKPASKKKSVKKATTKAKSAKKTSAKKSDNRKLSKRKPR